MKNTDYEYSCPVCGAEWYLPELATIDTIGCAGCGRKFNLENYLYEDEVLWTDWREKCYDRLMKEYDRNSDGENLVQEYEAIQSKITQDAEKELFNQILNDERNENR